MFNQPVSFIRARYILPVMILAMLFPTAGKAQLVVDCTNATPGAYSTINAALAASGPGTAIFVVAGPCNEYLNLAGVTDLFIGTYAGNPNVAINGSINVAESHGVYFHGLNVTSATGDGLNVSQSQALIIDTCNFTGNAGNGMTLGNASEALVIAPASFDGNSGYGIDLFGNSYVQFNSWNGQSLEISNNHNAGLWASQASFTTFGRTTISNNASAGVQLFGGAKTQFGSLSGPNVISGNQSGGISVQETSEVSFFNFGSQTYIQNNGPFGVSAGLGSQVTLYDGVEISGHHGPALDLYASSQGNMYGANNLHNNGTVGDARSAGIRVDGNSELFLRGGTVAQNAGPGILALVNSSVDLTGVSFSSNSGGLVVCDSSAVMVSDLSAGTTLAPGVGCRTPHALGNRAFTKQLPAVPDFTALKALQAKVMARATKH